MAMPMFCLDVAETIEGFFVLELNNIHCSGSYGHDLIAWYQAIDNFLR